jgi:hypothetical protein
MTYDPSESIYTSADLVLAAIDQEIAAASMRLTRLEKAKAALAGAVEPLKPLVFTGTTSAATTISNGPARVLPESQSEIRRRAWKTRRTNLAAKQAQAGKKAKARG